MSELFLFLFSCFGLTQILCYSRVLKPIRPSYYFFHCPMCVGFWVGAILCLSNSYIDLFNFGTTVYEVFLHACASSGFCYFMSMIIDDNGIRISKTGE